MNSKKWVISLISVTMVVVLLFGVLQYYLDPLLQYGGERGPLTYRKYNELYGNPGIAKNYDYNAVLLGSSIVEETNVSEINDIFRCETAKLPYAGGTSYCNSKILKVCYDSGNNIDKVFWALDENALISGEKELRWPLPEYLYDDIKINDLSYVLNLDIFYYYTLFDVKQTLNQEYDTLMMEGTWENAESLYSKENVLASVPYPKIQRESKGDKLYENNLLDNLKCNILPMIENHPETEFNFFMVPYSILYWYFPKSDGTLAANIYSVRMALGKLLEYDNVKIHFFQDEKEVITNLDLYRDYTHYKPEIISWMIREMNKGSHSVTKETYNQRLDDFYDYLNSYDYDSFFICG